jgi:hypothetical protein
MKLIIVSLILVLFGCGANVDVRGLHDVKVIHEVSVDNLIPYVRAYCTAAYAAFQGEVLPNMPDPVESCIELEIGKLISKMGGT